MVILSSLFREEVGPYQRAFQTSKLASWQSIFSLAFAFILWWLSASSWHGLHWDVICSGGSTGDRSLHTREASFQYRCHVFSATPDKSVPKAKRNVNRTADVHWCAEAFMACPVLRILFRRMLEIWLCF